MSGVGTPLAALLAGPPLALLGVSFGLGHRFGPGADLWPGATASLAAVGGAALAARVGTPAAAVVAMTVAAAVVPAGSLVGAAIDRRHPASGDPERRSATTVLLLVSVLAATALVRGDGPAGPAGAEPGGQVLLAGRVGAGPVQIAAAAVAVAVLAVVGSAITLPGVRLRLDAAARLPGLLVRVGVDPARVAMCRRAGTAATAALAGCLAATPGELSPSGAIDLTVLGVEVALLGGVGSVPGALVAGTALSLWHWAGDAVAPGWGPVAGHLVVAAVVAVRHGRSAMPSRAAGLSTGSAAETRP